MAFCGDNLASQQVGGFINLSSANRRCRHCLATKQEIQDKVYYFVHLCYTILLNIINCSLQLRNSPRGLKVVTVFVYRG